MNLDGLTWKAMRRLLLLQCLLAVLSLAAAPLQAAKLARPSSTVEGTVTKVHDGDSLWLTPPDKPPVVVHLRDIDAPEICQDHGPEARQALAELALNQKATLQITGRDEHGRTLGVVQVDGVDVGVRMVEEGHAWSIRSKWDQGPLVKQERMARALARGLHARGGAVMPRDFRASHGPCSGGDRAGASTGAAPAALPAAPPSAAPGAAPANTAFRCDGRTRCSQMRSCDEARYFQTHCPGARMDGNHDGVPCEAQWCGRR